MVSTNDIRPGQSILVDGIIYQIIEYQHVKPGKGKAFVKTKDITEIITNKFLFLIKVKPHIKIYFSRL
mgnify:CR=1 FL=1